MTPPGVTSAADGTAPSGERSRPIPEPVAGRDHQGAAARGNDNAHRALRRHVEQLRGRRGRRPVHQTRRNERTLTLQQRGVDGVIPSPAEDSRATPVTYPAPSSRTARLGQRPHSVPRARPCLPAITAALSWHGIPGPCRPAPTFRLQARTARQRRGGGTLVPPCTSGNQMPASAACTFG